MQLSTCVKLAIETEINPEGFLAGNLSGMDQAGGWRHGAKRSEPSRLTLQGGRVSEGFPAGNPSGFISVSIANLTYINSVTLQ